MSKRERVITPSEEFVKAEERAFELNRLGDAATSHEQAITTFERKIEEYEATISALDALFEAARAVPPFVTGYTESLSGNRVFGANSKTMSGRSTIHDVRAHVSHVAATAKAAVEVRLTDCRDQLVIARQNLVSINEGLARLEAA